MYEVGDRVNWARRPRGAYGCVQRVAGRVLHAGYVKATIAVVRQDGSFGRKRVVLGKLSPRAMHIPALDDAPLSKLRS